MLIASILIIYMSPITILAIIIALIKVLNLLILYSCTGLKIWIYMAYSIMYLPPTWVLGGIGISEQNSNITSEDLHYQIVVSHQSFIHPTKYSCDSSQNGVTIPTTSWYLSILHSLYQMSCEGFCSIVINQSVYFCNLLLHFGIHKPEA